MTRPAEALPNKPQSIRARITAHIYNPTTGELFQSEEAFFKTQKEQPEKAIFIELRNLRWMKEWPHVKNIAIANDPIAYYTPEGKVLPIDYLLTLWSTRLSPTQVRRSEVFRRCSWAACAESVSRP